MSMHRQAEIGVSARGANRVGSPPATQHRVRRNHPESASPFGPHGASGTRDVGVARDDPSPLRFEDLFAAERRRLVRSLCVIIPDPNEAEDVEQEAFVRVLERWPRVAGMDDPVGYLYRVAMNVYRSRRRRARVAATAPLPDRRDEIADVDDRDVVARSLGSLNPRQRAALVLTHALRYTSEEVGGILGVPASSVRVLTTRARAAVRRPA